MPYPLQTPLGPDGDVVIGPDGRPLYYPHFQAPGWVTFGAADARALGAYAFLRAFVNESEGELVSNVTTADIAQRFEVSAQVVSRKGGRRGNPPGLVQRLEAVGALHVHRRWRKTRTCRSCGAPAEVECPSTCTETAGRVRAAPRFELAAAPAKGFLHEGPLDRWEYHAPKRIAKRLREEGPESTLAVEARRQVLPFNQAMSWTAFNPQVGLEHLGVYAFIAAHTSMADGRLDTAGGLFRETIARRFGMSVSTVSEITRHLEQVGVISKTGLLNDAQGRRFGASGEPTGYVVRVSPPAGLRYPMPLHVGEWRSPERITQRMELMLSDGTLQFAHLPDDLRNVDNSNRPQGGLCAARRVWMCSPEGVDVQPGDLSTDPALQTPATDQIPSEGAQVQGGAEQGRTDEQTFNGGEGQGSPAARPAEVPHRGGAAPSVVAWQLLVGAEERLPRVAAPWRSLDDRERVAAELQLRLDEGWREGDLRRALTWQLSAAPAAWGLMRRAAAPAQFLPPSPPVPATAVSPPPGEEPLFGGRDEFQVGADGRAAETCPEHPGTRNEPGGLCWCGRRCRSVPGELVPEKPVSARPPEPRHANDFPQGVGPDEQPQTVGVPRSREEADRAFAAPWCGQRCHGDWSSPRYRTVTAVVAGELVARPCPTCGHRVRAEASATSGQRV